MNLIITGPSGVGKDTVIKELINRVPSQFIYNVSATTRLIRPGETNGIDYHFVNRDVFEKWIAQNALLEYKLYNGEYYGRKKMNSAINNKVVIYKADVPGAISLKQLLPNSISVILIPHNEEELRVQLIGRDGTNNINNINQRMSISHTELKSVDKFDYQIVNKRGCLEKTIQELIRVINREFLNLG